MTLNPCTSFPAVTEIQDKEDGLYLGNGADAPHQLTPDSASSSNGASPTTPFDHRPFTFSDYQDRKQFADVLSNLPTPLVEDKPSSLGTDTVSTLTIDSPLHHQQKPLQKSHHHTSDTESSHPSFVLTILPDTPSHDNDGDPNATLNTDDNHPPPLSTKSSSSTLLRHQQASVTENDSISIGNSSYSVDCTDFPSPPSSTPSLVPLVPRLKIQTNIQEPVATAASATHPANKMTVTSRFKEVFDLDGTDLEWDYDIKYRRPCSASPLNNPLPTKSTPSFVPISATNDHHTSKQQHRHMITGFMTTIGRSTSSSSSPPTTTAALSKRMVAPETPVRSLSTSSGTGNSSIRGLMRSLSTTATNHYRQQIPKMTLNNVAPPLIEEDGMTKAAQIVASTTDDDNTMHNTLAHDNASLLTATSFDGRRQKITQLLSNAIKKAPTRRHTTKVVNMQPSPDTKKLVRRTVIYVNSAELANSESEIIRHYRPHRPAPSPPCTQQQQPYRYEKRLPAIPAKPSPTSSPRSSTASSSSSSSSSSFAATPTSSPVKQLPYLEGLELREMEDGTMEWGIIQKQGHRQSFFPMTHADEDGEGEIEQDVLALLGLAPDHLEKLSLSSRSPPPIPRRSPRRKPSMALTTKATPAAALVEPRNDEDESTTDTYYAHEMNLPSLLRLMSETQQHSNLV